MNVFGTIKEKFSSVPQNISAGLKSLTSREEEPQDSFQCDGVSVDAGAELLNKFQENWSLIHEDAEVNAKKAEEVDGLVNKFYLEVERQNDTMNEFLSHATFMPELVLSLDATMELLGELSSKVSDLESDLRNLEDVCEELELENNRGRHLNELKLYRERKSVEIEQVKAKLAREHADKAAAHESKLQATLQEKQAIFEGTYTEAMEDYKLFGQSRLNTPGYRTQSSSSGPDLASITLEQDTADLDAFLATEDQSAADPPKEDKAAIATNESPSAVSAIPEAGDTQSTTETKHSESETKSETKPDEGAGENKSQQSENETKTAENAGGKEERKADESKSEASADEMETENKSETAGKTPRSSDNAAESDKDNNNTSATQEEVTES